MSEPLKLIKTSLIFIAVIDPLTFQSEFDATWSRGEFDDPLKALRYSIVSENLSSVWVKWPVKTCNRGKKR
nr:hypothetical protein [Escherichia coli]